MNKNPKNNRFVVIDGNSLINRAYYAIQRPMMTKEGLYTQGVYGFLNMLQKIQSDYNPAYLTVAFDRKAPTFRHLEYSEYKADRKGMPPELAMQLPLLKEVLDAMKIKTLEIDGFEADDIIGTVAKRAEAEGFEPLIITGDKDALQLASSKTKVIITQKGISQFESYIDQDIIEKYGFTPEQFIDYKGLMGDQSDNIPGLPGVGEKTARKLILEFGSVANLIDQIENISNEKLRNKIKDNIQLAIMSRRLAEIETNVPIETNFSEFILEEPDYEKLIEIYRRLEFNSFLKKLRPETLPSCTSGIKPQIIIKKPAQLFALEKSIKKNNTITLKVFSDNNHKDIPEIYGISILTDDLYFYLDSYKNDMKEALEELFHRFDVKIIGHQLQSDYYALMCKGFSNWSPKVVFDTAIAQYLLQPERSSYELGTLSMEFLYKDFKDLASFATDEGQIGFLENNEAHYDTYGAQWCETVLELKTFLEQRLLDEGLISVFKEIELPLIPVLASMEVEGFAIDKKELQDAGQNLREQLDKLTALIYEYAGKEFNINSPKQLGDILFEKMKLPSGKKTKTGYSTSADVLEGIRGKHKIIDLILEYRTLSKLNGTYVEGLLPLIHKDGKIHAHFQQTVAATGRISCTEPNLQNIPIRQELGRKLRRAFIPQDDDFILVSADYSQIELRVLAHMSQDPSLIQSFNEGADIHRTTASKVFGVSESQVTSLQRSNAKAVNFGVIYGMSSFGLSAELNISRREAENYIKEYFRKYTKVKEFLDIQVAFCKQNGYVTTIMNRKRPVHEINAANYMVRQAGERLAMNSPIQGSAADIIKLAMIRCHEQLQRENMKSRLILQVHDELIIQASKDELKRVESLLVENMENAVKLEVKLTVDLNTGSNWYELT
ncbi:MAG: DNA polymerase I [Eubacteriales bacterium]|nr:DNA polymerase I [Eubacteriales bacterium]